MKISISILLFLLNFIFPINTLEIQDISDRDIDSSVGDGSGTWLLMFYLETCPHCQGAKQVFDTISMREDLTGPDSLLPSLQIGKIECSANNWSCMRFNITRVPYIVMLQNNQMFEYNFYVTEEKLMKFLTGDKTVGDALKIPTMLGWTGIVFKIFEETVNMLNESIQAFIDEKFGWDFKWNTYHSILLMINSLILMICIEWIVISRCFGKKKIKVEVEKAKQEIKQEEFNEKNAESRPKESVDEVEAKKIN